MYIYVEEVNLKVSAGVHAEPGQMPFLDPFQQWIIILLGCFCAGNTLFHKN